MGRIIVLVIALSMFPQCLYAENVLTLGKPADPVADLSTLILKEAYKRIGYVVHIKTMPAERSLLASNAGVLDGDVNRIEGIEKLYPNLVRVPVSINFIQGVAFTARDDVKVSGWKSLSSYRIGVRIGTKFAEKGTKGMLVYKLPTNEQLFILVSKLRYDLGIASRLEALYEINRQNLMNVKILEPPLIHLDLYHYLNNKHGELVAKINGVLTRMQNQGMLSKMRQDYIERL